MPNDTCTVKYSTISVPSTAGVKLQVSAVDNIVAISLNDQALDYLNGPDHFKVQTYDLSSVTGPKLVPGNNVLVLALENLGGPSMCGATLTVAIGGNVSSHDLTISSGAASVYAGIYGLSVVLLNVAS